MMKIKPDNLRTLGDIRLEKERLRYMALRTELEFAKGLRQTKKLFTFPNIFTQTQLFIANYTRKIVSSWFK